MTPNLLIGRDFTASLEGALMVEYIEATSCQNPQVRITTPHATLYADQKQIFQLEFGMLKNPACRPVGHSFLSALSGIETRRVS